LQRLGLKRADGARVLGTEVEFGAARTFAGDLRFGGGGDLQIRAMWTRAVVVGVVAQEAGSGSFISSRAVAQRARDWTTASADADQLDLPTSPYSGVFVVADGLDEVAPVRNAITAIGYSTQAPENLIASVRRYLHVVEIVLGGIGAVALGVATIGIANAMLAAVRERRREIGVLKAIGARDRDIRRAFIVEAGTIGFVGGAIGALLGFGLAKIVAVIVNQYLTSQGLVTVSVGFPVRIVALAIAGATALALLGGLWPAQRAARLPAREAVAGG
jgi:cell division protein FtsX